MRLYSFDRAAGHPIDRFGSDFVLSPLMDPGGSGRVVCFHLAAGEVVGEHEAVTAQLFCVVDGDGWVSGGDAVRTPIRAWQAAYWRPGERHAAGSASGLTAIVVEGDGFDVRAKPLDNDSQ